MTLEDDILARRWRCRECRAITVRRDMLTAPSPFERGSIIWGCPECLCSLGFDQLCDVPGCDEQAGCGWPSPAGYRRTCGRHMMAEDGSLDTPGIVN